ncbi:hypothetical protein U27_00795 [Candidatus Vecturithrix granuli]|uniref:Uncharacterized protein n=1 Tax=Vecturithrix granuli TaxID=1499967 RepID=A0A081C8J2_VECG1|nr:hypothetical protein U27_00795 [Candidatus Vecturithrix granuli]
MVEHLTVRRVTASMNCSQREHGEIANNPVAYPTYLKGKPERDTQPVGKAERHILQGLMAMAKAGLLEFQCLVV